MTPERFRSLTEAYGAAPEHWPQAERAAAQALLERQDPEVLAALASARQLDQFLAAHQVAQPTPALVSRIIVSASPASRWNWLRCWTLTRRPAANPLRGWPGQTAPSFRIKTFAAALGLLGVCLAGIVTGACLMSLPTAAVSLPTRAPSLTELSYSSTAFGGSTQDWGNE